MFQNCFGIETKIVQVIFEPFKVRYENCSGPIDEIEAESDGSYDESYEYSDYYDSEAYADLFD